MATFKMIMVDKNQLFELSSLEKAFSENAIDYMLLKGALIKSLYPKTEMRPMGDADVLIRTEQYDKIKPIMQKLGFSAKLESDHEIVWDKPGKLYLELHKRLIPSYHKDYYAYFGEGWNLAKQNSDNPYRYEMTSEDTYIYLFAHFAKHYREGGIGIRHLIDLWMYRKSCKKLDEEYIKQGLEKLLILEFYTNIRRLSAVWFEGAEADEKTDFITNVIFSSGSFGTSEKRQISSGLKASKSGKNVKTTKWIRAIFPNKIVMANNYPILRKAPALMPLMWVARWFRTILFRKNQIKGYINYVKQLSPENISTYQEALNYVGLDFNFKE